MNEYKRNKIYLISGSLGIDSDGVAHPDITSKGNFGSDTANAIAMLELVGNPEEF